MERELREARDERDARVSGRSHQGLQRGPRQPADRRGPRHGERQESPFPDCADAPQTVRDDARQEHPARAWRGADALCQVQRREEQERHKAERVSRADDARAGWRGHEQQAEDVEDSGKDIPLHGDGEEPASDTGLRGVVCGAGKEGQRRPARSFRGP